MAKAAKAKIDPFKVKKTSDAKAGGSKMAVQTAPKEIQASVDAYRKAQDQAKHFEGEAQLHKEAITAYSRSEYAHRAFGGDRANFKIAGAEAFATYIVMDSSSGLSDEDVDKITDEFGENTAEELTEPDFASLKFDPKVLAENYDQVVSALQKLPAEILENLFKPMTKKAVKGACEKAAAKVEDEKKLERLMSLLKIKNYIR